MVELPEWYDGKTVNEVKFCEEFLREHPMKSVNGTFFTVEGRVTDEDKLRREIYEMLKPLFSTALGKRVNNLLEALRLEAYAPDLPIQRDRNLGANGIASWLNQHGYKKKKRQNNTLSAFSASFVKGVLDNPVYCGKLAYGRRKNEKIPGKRDSHIVKQSDYMLYDGIHDAIISETDWREAHNKRRESGFKREKVHSLDHEHILSGILRCPVCGAGMYGNVNRKKKPDGSSYRDYFYYVCKHRREIDGHLCDYRRQWSEDKVNKAVEEVIIKLVQNPKFEAAVREKINARIDTSEIENEIETLKKQRRQVLASKDRLSQQIDTLDIDDRQFERKYQDMQVRLDALYNELDSIEDAIAEAEQRIDNIRRQKINGENVYKYLLCFDRLYDKFTDAEKKEFISSFVDSVEIYKSEQPDGRFLKRIRFHFPVYFKGKEVQEISWDEGTTVETVCLLSKLNTKQNIEAQFDRVRLDQAIG